MKFLSDNVLVLMLTLVMGLSPLQNIVASVSNCMSMGDAMPHQMNVSGQVAPSDMNQSDMKHDCCSQNECGTTHCASATVAAIASKTSNNNSGIIYLFNSAYQKSVVSLTSFYPSSLYRPPKI